MRDEWRRMSKKVVVALMGTVEALEPLEDPFRSAGVSALEEFYFRLTGKHADLEYVLTEQRKFDGRIA